VRNQDVEGPQALPEPRRQSSGGSELAALAAFPLSELETSSVFNDAFLQSIVTPTSTSDGGPTAASPLSNLDYLSTSAGSSDLYTSLPTPITSFPRFMTECLPDNFDEFLNDPLFLPTTIDTNLISQPTTLPTPGADGGSAGHAAGSSPNNASGTTDKPSPPSASIRSPAQTQPETTGPLEDGIKAGHCCLFAALGLMKSISKQSTECRVFDGTEAPGDTTTVPTIEDVITRNQATIETVGRMLQCSCVHDGYLLALILLIVFKVLAWYDAAARLASPGRGSTVNLDGRISASGDDSGKKNERNVEKVHHSPSIIYSYQLNGEDSGRMTAQLVLSELNRVQRLVKVLEDRLRSLSGIVDGDSVVIGAMEMECDDMQSNDGRHRSSDEHMSSFSLLILGRMVDHVKKNLKSLSSGIIRTLNSS
jgi:hypothetical protein